MFRGIIGIQILVNLFLVNGLFEDQIGKFDWRLENIGNVNHASFDASYRNKHVLVTSEENVVAALTTSTGQIVWRHVMEETTHALGMFNTDSYLYTVTTSMVRKWNSQTGHVVWEAAYIDQITPNSWTTFGNTLVIVTHSDVLAISLTSGQELWTLNAPWMSRPDAMVVTSVEDTSYISVLTSEELTVYSLKDEIIKQYKKIPIQTANIRCKGTGEWLICLDETVADVLMINLVTPESKLSTTAHLQSTEAVREIEVDSDGYVLLKLDTIGYLYKAGNPQHILQYKGIGSLTSNSLGQKILMSVHNSPSDKSLEVRAYSLTNGNELDTYRATLSSSHIAPPVMLVPLIYKNREGVESYRLIVKYEDLTLSMLQQTGVTLWNREEGLSQISSLEAVDLPVSEVQAQMEEEFGQQSEGSVISQLCSRVTSQLQQLTAALTHTYSKYVTGLRVVMETEDHTSLDEDYLTRDEFGLHKILVAVSKSGKVYGLDSYTGKVIWSHYVPSLGAFPESGRILLFIQRTTAHFPHPAVATVIGNLKKCGDCGSVFYSFNPITGMAYTPEPVIYKQKLDQAMMLHTPLDNYIKPIVMLDIHKQVQVYPEDSELTGTADQPLEYFLYTALKSTGSVVGLRLSGLNLQSLKATLTWSFSLNDKIVALSSRPYRENLHSLGRVLPDRSVLYKYSNPNLVAVATENEANSDHSSVSIHLFDAVSGRVIFSCEHKKSSSPVHLVHSENWVVYSYYNMKYRRVEIAVLELYEGSTQSNSTAFSSLGSSINPLVMRQAYILGTSVSALATTITERGITGKSILVARTVGGIVEVPKMLLDPRRPETPTPQSREEGLAPYTPELPMSYEWTINYNQSVYRIREIHTEPSGLESTSLVIAYGLDVFHTRVAPSKMYDVLKDDFDYIFIGAVTVGMIVVSLVTRQIALRKMVSRAWK